MSDLFESIHTSRQSTTSDKSIFQWIHVRMGKIFLLRPKRLSTVLHAASTETSSKEDSLSLSSPSSKSEKMMTSLSLPKQVRSKMTAPEQDVTIGRKSRQEIQPNQFAGHPKLMMAKGKAKVTSPKTLLTVHQDLPAMNAVALSSELKSHDIEKCNHFVESSDLFRENSTAIGSLISEWKGDNLAQRKLSFILNKFSNSLVFCLNHSTDFLHV